MIALTALFSLAAPIPQAVRAAFLQALAPHHEVGAGLIYRVGRSLQRQFLNPPAHGRESEGLDNSENSL